jgi:hypothetical protein
MAIHYRSVSAREADRRRALELAKLSQFESKLAEDSWERRKNQATRTLALQGYESFESVQAQLGYLSAGDKALADYLEGRYVEDSADLLVFENEALGALGDKQSRREKRAARKARRAARKKARADRRKQRKKDRAERKKVKWFRRGKLRRKQRKARWKKYRADRGAAQKEYKAERKRIKKERKHRRDLKKAGVSSTVEEVSPEDAIAATGDDAAFVEEGSSSAFAALWPTDKPIYARPAFIGGMVIFGGLAATFLLTRKKPEKKPEKKKGGK